MQPLNKRERYKFDVNKFEADALSGINKNYNVI